jgi:hypothetical protein
MRYPCWILAAERLLSSTVVRGIRNVLLACNRMGRIVGGRRTLDATSGSRARIERAAIAPWLSVASGQLCRPAVGKQHARAELNRVERSRMPTKTSQRLMLLAG